MAKIESPSNNILSTWSPFDLLRSKLLLPVSVISYDQTTDVLQINMSHAISSRIRTTHIIIYFELKLSSLFCGQNDSRMLRSNALATLTGSFSEIGIIKKLNCIISFRVFFFI